MIFAHLHWDLDNVFFLYLNRFACLYHILPACIYIFGDGHFFLSLSKLVGESVPLPTPRKVNTCKISASEPPKAPKRKVVPPLAPSRTLNMKRDRTNSLPCERANPEHVANEAHRCTSSTEDTLLLDEDDVAHIKRERTQSKTDSVSSIEDHIAIQEENVSKIDDNAIEDDMSLKSNQDPNRKMNGDLELHKSNCPESILIHPEAHFEPEDKSLNGDKFSKEERSDIIDNLEAYEALNLKQHLSNEEKELSSDSTKLRKNVSEKKQLLFECNVVSTEEENNILQDYKIKSENIASRDESETQRDKSNISKYDSLNKDMNESTRTIELTNEQLKLLDHQSCKRPLRVPRKRVSSPKDATSDTERKSDFGREEDTCTIISTIPKCDHFDRGDDDTSNNTTKYNTAEDLHELRQKPTQTDQSEESNNTKTAKRTKMIRSQSKSEDFEVDTLKRQKRHLTSPQEDIAHALNLNFSARNSVSSQKEQEEINAKCRDDRARDEDVNKRESHDGLITGACHYITNILF